MKLTMVSWALGQANKSLRATENGLLSDCSVSEPVRLSSPYSISHRADPNVSRGGVAESIPL